MHPKHLAGYVFLAVAWGLSFLLVLEVVAAFGWIGAVAFRALVAGATLLVVARATGRRLVFAAGWRPYAAVGATTVAGQLVGISYATPRIGTALAAIFVAAIPLFSMVIAQLWGLERITRRGLGGLLLGFAGIVALVGFPAMPITGEFLVGCAASLGGSLCAAFGSNYANRRLHTVDPFEVTTGAFLAGALLVLPLLVAVPVPTAPRPIDFVWLLVLGGVMSATTYVVYFKLVAAIGATRAISVEFAVTAVAVVAGALLLDERLSPVQLAGGAMIVTGCALVLGLVPRVRTRR